jgi:hypothetical protein
MGTLDRPGKFVPTGHAHIEERVDWFDVHDSLPRFAETAGRGAKPVSEGPGKR